MVSAKVHFMESMNSCKTLGKGTELLVIVQCSPPDVQQCLSGSVQNPKHLPGGPNHYAWSGTGENPRLPDYVLFNLVQLGLQKLNHFYHSFYRPLSKSVRHLPLLLLDVEA